MIGRAVLCLGLFAVAVAPVHARDILVADQRAFAEAAEDLRAGDTIILANGTWEDFEIAISGEGTESEPITLTAQVPGQVFLTGQSNLRIGGQHIVVRGLVFRDGYSPTGEVISFRRDSDDLAHYARVTETVIDGFSKPDRNESDYWVALYGSNNRFDHNHLVGKTNRGVTLAVRLNTAESRENRHRIDHNYFGPRPNLASNGGETLRIGTSHYSMFNSNTLVENNVFDRTDGEVEIISVKAGGNIVRGNLFLRSRGALTLRHGDGNLIERNVFLGHGKDHTGGIRVINRDQTVRENYMEGLRGTGFSSALTVMNGVPNSPVNRYVQVENVRIERNSVLDSTRVTLGAGADEERSAPPVDTWIAGNLFGGTASGTFIGVESDISGIAFSNNAVLAGRVDEAAAILTRVESGLERGANGLLYPIDPALAEIGAPRDLRVHSLDEVGVAWYSKPATQEELGSGREIAVASSGEALRTALARAEDGDVLLLAPGDYHLDRTLPVDRAITLRGAPGAGADRAVLRFTRPALFELRENGALRLENLVVDGALAPDEVGNAVIRTGSHPIRGNLAVEMEGVEVRNLTVNRDFDVIYFGPSTLADRVHIVDSSFADISGTIVSAAAEADDQGRYNVEYLTIENSAFRNVAGGLAEVYRGGRDESTFGPHVRLTRSRLDNVGSANAPSLLLHGVQWIDLADNAIARSAPISIIHTVGEPRTVIRGNDFTGTPEPRLEELVFPGAPRVTMQDNSFSREVAQ